MSDLKVLELFNTRAERIHRLKRFLESLNSNREVTFRIAGNNVEVTELGPDEESISAAILTLRMFIQDNEPISFRNMEALYSRLNVSEDLKAQFKNLRSELNGYLDDRYSPLTMESDGMSFGKLSTPEPNSVRLTNRQLMEYYIYGDYAHSNQGKREVFERITQDPMFALLGNFAFVTILKALVVIIDHAVELNKQAMEQLK